MMATKNNDQDFMSDDLRALLTNDELAQIAACQREMKEARGQAADILQNVQARMQSV